MFWKNYAVSVIGRVPRDGMISPPGIIPESIITTSPVFIHSQFTQRGFGWLERRNWWIVVESRDRWIFVKKRRGKRNLFSCSCQKKSRFIKQCYSHCWSHSCNKYSSLLSAIQLQFQLVLAPQKGARRHKLLAISCTFLANWKINGFGQRFFPE